MNKKTFFIAFVILIGVFVYPSFRSSGVDCLAGCSMPKGFPLAYSINYGSGFIGGDSSEFLVGPFILDVVVWLLVSVALAKIVHYFRIRSVS